MDTGRMKPLADRANMAQATLDKFAPHFLKFQEVHGWLSDAEATALYVLASSIQAENPVVVEIGSFQGKSSVCIAGGLLDTNPKGRLFCVDPFDATDQEQYIKSKINLKVSSLYGKFIANTWRYPNITAVPGFSVPVAQDPDSGIPNEIDMLFIDGNHGYTAVRDDLLAWVPSLKAGGILAMHDIDLAGDTNIVATLCGGWCTDPIRVVCDLGIGLTPLGWANTTRVETLLVTMRTTEQWQLLLNARPQESSL